MHTKHSRIQWILSRKCTLSHKGITDRSIQLSCKLCHLSRSSREHGSAAHKDKWPLCFCYHGRCLVHILFPNHIGLPFCYQRLLVFILCLIGCYILGHINKHRTGPSAFCNVKGSPNSRSQFFHILNNIIMLCNRHGNSGNIYLLKGISSQQGLSYISRNGNHRNRIHIGRCNSRNQVGRTRSGGCHTYAYLSRSTGISVRRMGSSLLMGGQNMGYLIAVFI